MLAQTLDPAEILLADVAGVRFRVPRQERAYPGIQGNGTRLGLANAPLRLYSDRQGYCPLCSVNLLSLGPSGTGSAMRRLPRMVWYTP